MASFDDVLRTAVGETQMGGVGNKDNPTKRPAPRAVLVPPAMSEDIADPEDDEYEDGDFATPKRDRSDPDDEPL